MIAFWMCRRFSASSHTRLCGPSITSAETSSPRCAGRQCRKIAFLSARLHQLRAHGESAERALALLLLLLLTHRRPDVGVDDVRALRGFHRVAKDSYLRDLLRAREQMIGRLVAFGTRDVEIEAEAIRGVDPRVRHVVAVADPRVLLVRRSSPRCWRTVRRSARIWQGCSRSVRPLMTGTSAYFASSSTSWCANVRIMMPSRSATARAPCRRSARRGRAGRRAARGRARVRPAETCRPRTTRACACDAFMKIMASVFPASGFLSYFPPRMRSASWNRPVELRARESPGWRGNRTGHEVGRSGSSGASQ